MKYSNNFNKKSRVFEAKYIERYGIKYYVDGKNVVLDYTKSELEMAKWLVSIFGGIIYLLPRVNYPKNIKTADYLWNNEFWDLKELKKNAISKKRAIDNLVKNYKSQSNNFIIDITESILSNEIIVNQIFKIYDDKQRNWINIIILIKNYQIILILKRKKRGSPSPQRARMTSVTIIYNKIEIMSIVM